MREPGSGYLLAGDTQGNQQVYERDDALALENAKQHGTPLEERWFHVGDPHDSYRFDDLARDYGAPVHLIACGHPQCDVT